MKILLEGIPDVLKYSIAIVTLLSLAVPFIKTLIDSYLKTEQDLLFMPVSEKKLVYITKNITEIVFYYLFFLYCMGISGAIIYSSSGDVLNNSINYVMGYFLFTLLIIIIWYLSSLIPFKKILNLNTKNKIIKKINWKKIIKLCLVLTNFFSFMWLSGYIILIFISDYNKGDFNILPIIVLSIIAIILYNPIYSHFIPRKVSNINYEFRVLEKSDISGELYYQYTIQDDLLMLFKDNKDKDEFFIYDKSEKVYYQITKKVNK